MKGLLVLLFLPAHRKLVFFFALQVRRGHGSADHRTASGLRFHANPPVERLWLGHPSRHAARHNGSMLR